MNILNINEQQIIQLRKSEQMIGNIHSKTIIKFLNLKDKEMGIMS